MDRQNSQPCTCRNPPARPPTSPTRGFCPRHNIRPATWPGAEAGNVDAATPLLPRSPSTNSGPDNVNVAISPPMHASTPYSATKPRSPTSSHRNVEPSTRPDSIYATPYSTPCHSRPVTQYYTPPQSPGSTTTSSTHPPSPTIIPPPPGFRQATFYISSSESSPASSRRSMSQNPDIINRQSSSTSEEEEEEEMAIDDAQGTQQTRRRCCNML